MILIPSSNGEDTPLFEFNTCHGKTDGKFCSKGAGGAGYAAFEAKAVENLAKTSRTAKGVNDVTAGGGDKPKLAVGEGEELAQKTAENFKAALRLAWDHRDAPLDTPAEVASLIEHIGATVSDGLLQPGQSLWREHETKNHQTPPAKIAGEMKAFAEQLHRRLSDPKDDSVATAAWVEQRLDGQIHPFTDGCGRSTKVLSAFVLSRADHALPTYIDRKGYYTAINQSPAEWERYYRTLFSARVQEVNRCHGKGKGHPCTGGARAKPQGFYASDAPIKGGNKGFIAHVESWGYRNPIYPREIVINNEAAVELQQNDYAPNSVHISSFRAFAPGKGIGARVLHRLTKAADRAGVALTLVSSPLAGQQWRTPKGRLTEFYKAFGFKGQPFTMGRGLSKDHLIRKPRA